MSTHVAGGDVCYAMREFRGVEDTSDCSHQLFGTLRSPVKLPGKGGAIEVQVLPPGAPGSFHDINDILSRLWLIS